MSPRLDFRRGRYHSPAVCSIRDLGEVRWRVWCRAHGSGRDAKAAETHLSQPDLHLGRPACPAPGQGKHHGHHERLERRTGPAEWKRPDTLEGPSQPQAARRQEVGPQVREVPHRERGDQPRGKTVMEKQPAAHRDGKHRVGYAAMAKNLRPNRGEGAQPLSHPGFRMVDVGQQGTNHGKPERKRRDVGVTQMWRHAQPGGHPERHM